MYSSSFFLHGTTLSRIGIVFSFNTNPVFSAITTSIANLSLNTLKGKSLLRTSNPVMSRVIPSSGVCVVLNTILGSENAMLKLQSMPASFLSSTTSSSFFLSVNKADCDVTVINPWRSLKCLSSGTPVKEALIDAVSFQSLFFFRSSSKVSTARLALKTFDGSGIGSGKLNPTSNP